MQAKLKPLPTDTSLDMTCSVGESVTLDPRKLHAVYPNYDDSGEVCGKVTKTWIFEYKKELFTVYDWKSTSEYDERCPPALKFWNQSSVTLNVGGRYGSKYAQEFVKALIESLNK